MIGEGAREIAAAELRACEACRSSLTTNGGSTRVFEQLWKIVWQNPGLQKIHVYPLESFKFLFWWCDSQPSFYVYAGQAPWPRPAHASQKSHSSP